MKRMFLVSAILALAALWCVPGNAVGAITPADVSYTIDATTPADSSYGDSGDELSDGVDGDTGNMDSWVGWQSQHAKLTFDLGSARTLTSIKINYLNNEAIMATGPSSAAISYSTDGTTYSDPCSYTDFDLLNAGSYADGAHSTHASLVRSAGPNTPSLSFLPSSGFAGHGGVVASIV